MNRVALARPAVAHPARIALGGLVTNQPAITDASSTGASESRMTLKFKEPFPSQGLRLYQDNVVGRQA